MMREYSQSSSEREILLFQPKTAKPGMAKSEGKQKIFSNGKGKESTDNTGGWPKPCFLPSRGCLVNMYPQPGFKTG